MYLMKLLRIDALPIAKWSSDSCGGVRELDLIYRFALGKWLQRLAFGRERETINQRKSELLGPEMLDHVLEPAGDVEGRRVMPGIVEPDDFLPAGRVP